MPADGQPSALLPCLRLRKMFKRKSVGGGKWNERPTYRVGAEEAAPHWLTASKCQKWMLPIH
ncbi:hypothetical protein AAHK20_33270 [Trinickia sp. YCB016]